MLSLFLEGVLCFIFSVIPLRGLKLCRGGEVLEERGDRKVCYEFSSFLRLLR